MRRSANAATERLSLSLSLAVSPSLCHDVVHIHKHKKNSCDVHLLVIVIKLLPTNAVRIQPYELQLI